MLLNIGGIYVEMIKRNFVIEGTVLKEGKEGERARKRREKEIEFRNGVHHNDM